MTILELLNAIFNQLDVLTVINFVVIVFLSVSWFKDHYTILDNDTFITMATKYNEIIEAENDNCGGGVGFSIPNEMDYEEDEEEDKSSNKKVVSNRKVGF